MAVNARRSWRTLACAVPLLLAACGGGGGSQDNGAVPPPLSCRTADLQDWLQTT